jgi:hypothetical protein
LTNDLFIELWGMAEESFADQTVEEVEVCKRFRTSNHTMNKDDSQDQRAAQYGRILWGAFVKVARALDLQPHDTYLDVGSGVGNTVLQAAYEFACHSRGIEVDGVRHAVSTMFHEALAGSKLAKEFQENITFGPIGEVKLVHGRLEDPGQFELMTTPQNDNGVMKVFFNNYNGVFSDKSDKPGAEYSLDGHFAGLFCCMPIGSVVVTCHPLVLPPCVCHYEQIDLGSANETVSWAGGGNRHRVWGHKYTRVGPGDLSCANCGAATFIVVENGKRIPHYCCDDKKATLRSSCCRR